MPIARSPKGKLILHPNHWLFEQLAYPRCDSGCGQEIFPLTSVEMEVLPNNVLARRMFRKPQRIKRKAVG